MIFCEHDFTMLSTELDPDPKIKVVTLIEFYNFVLGSSAMQSLYSDVQHQSNMQLEIDGYTRTMT